MAHGPDDDARLNRSTVPVSPRETSSAPTRTSREPDAPQSRIPSVFDPIDERFEEQAELGRGGMGRVVEAFDRVLDRTVAIKHSLASDPHDEARFEREVRITAQLQHPGIVPIIDAARDRDGKPFYVMRKIDGEPLHRKVAAAATIRDRLALVPAVLAAVNAAAYAHARGIVHRDIKPSNILIGPFGETLLIDWGLAGVLDDNGRAPADGFGTPGFVAPEQASGDGSDRRSDVYSLGATLRYVVGTDRDAGAPVELIAILDKALADDPDARYSDAGELAADLERFLAGKLVAAHAYTALQLVGRWIRAHRLVTAVTAAAIAAIAIISTIAVRRVVAERDDAEAARRLAELRAEEMLVDRARSLVAIDPTTAAAILRGLPPSSTLWPIAREIVRVAAAGGVERALIPHRAPITVAAFGPGGKLATSSVDGTIQIHDLAAGTSTVAAQIAADDLGWLDATTLVYARNGTITRADGLETSAPPTLGVLDLRDGRQRVVAREPYRDLRAFGGRIVLLADGVVVAIAADGTRETLAHDIGAIDVRRGRLAMLGRAQLIVIDAAGRRREQPVTAAEPIFAVRLSPSGDRVAGLMNGALVEWSLGDSRVRTWARSTEAIDARPHSVGPGHTIQTFNADAHLAHGTTYIGETLYGWSLDGRGALAFAADEPSPVWPVQRKPLAIAYTSSRGVMVTQDGRVAVVGPHGTVELVHRSLELRFVASDPDGERVALCTAANELMVLDLDAISPRITPLAPAEDLYAIAGDSAVVGTRGDRESARLALLDLAHDRRTELGAAGLAPTVDLGPSRIVAAGTDHGLQVATWDLAGHELSRIVAEASAVGPGLDGGTSLFHVAAGGDIVETPLDPAAAPHRIGHIDVRDPRGGVPLVTLAASGGGVTALVGAGPTKRFAWIDRSGQHDRELARPGTVGSAAYTSDGTWWYGDFRRVLRVSPGSDAIEVPMPTPIHIVRRVGDEVWGMGEQMLVRIGAAGAVLGTATLPGAGDRIQVERGVIASSPRGIEVVMPFANTRRVLALPRTPSRVVASDDARSIAAVVELPGGGRAIASWRDPVPGDPAAVAELLDRLTNGRLAPGSDAIVWDR